MKTRATATFRVLSWDESAYDEMDHGPRLTRARVAKSFEGEIEGSGAVEYLMVYREDGTAQFVGLERITGRVGDRSGSFVLEHGGTFEGETASATWTVVPGSGTGDLKGLRGEGGFESGHAEEYTMTLDYDFE